MLLVHEYLNGEKVSTETISYSDELDTARIELIEYLEHTATDFYTVGVLTFLDDKFTDEFDGEFEIPNGVMIDRYEWLCESTANDYRAIAV